jgi:predicted nucleic acid-binding protein
MAFLEDEPAAEAVQELIAEAQDIDNGLLVPAINLGEVWHSLARVKSEEAADCAITEIMGLGFQIIDVDWDLANRAARLKTKYRLSYADCIAASLASRRAI